MAAKRVMEQAATMKMDSVQINNKVMQILNGLIDSREIKKELDDLRVAQSDIQVFEKQLEKMYPQ